MFNKRASEPTKRPLQGEDFNIFPDLGDYKPSQEEDEPARPSEPKEEEAPPEPTAFEKKMAAIPEEKWKLYQLIGGIVLGVLSAASIVFLGRTETFGTLSIIVAAGLALFVPNTLEKKGGRKAPRLRNALMITLLITMGLFMFYGFVIDPTYFKTVPSATVVPAASPTPTAAQ